MLFSAERATILVIPTGKILAIKAQAKLIAIIDSDVSLAEKDILIAAD